MIQEVFARCFVDCSVKLGLIPDPLGLVLAGDGTCIRTEAGHFGVKVCDCRKKGVFSCDCKRRFTDPQARWGWNSYRQEYFCRTVYTKPHDDLRLFTPTPRNSKAWRSVYSLRSGSERSFSRKKKDYELERCLVRSLRAWCWRAHFVAMNQHLDAWVEHAVKEQAFDVWVQVLGSSVAAA